MNYLFDTNVLSELTAKDPDANVVTWVENIDQENIFLCVVAIEELKKGIEKLAGSRKKMDLISWLENDLLIRFGARIIPFDLPVILVWGTMVADLEKAGTPLPAIDSLLAASASQRGLTLVTRKTLIENLTAGAIKG